MLYRSGPGLAGRGEDGPIAAAFGVANARSLPSLVLAGVRAALAAVAGVCLAC